MPQDQVRRRHRPHLQLLQRQVLREVRRQGGSQIQQGEKLFLVKFINIFMSSFYMQKYSGAQLLFHQLYNAQINQKTQLEFMLNFCALHLTMENFSVPGGKTSDRPTC